MASQQSTQPMRNIAWAGTGLGVIAIFSAITALTNGSLDLTFKVCDIGALVIGVFITSVWVSELRRQTPAPAVSSQPVKPYDPAAPAPQPGPIARPFAPPPPPVTPLYSADALAQRAEPQNATTNPFADIPWLRLPEVTGNARVFILPKEGESLQVCQDFYGMNPKRQCYVVADGAGGTFLPRPWAALVASSLAADSAALDDEARFYDWLTDLGRQWRETVEERWVAARHTDQQQHGQPLIDYSTEISQRGAQTTMIACELHPAGQATKVNFTAIGDATAFLFRPHNAAWQLKLAFPLNDTEQFTANPPTFSTLDDDAMRAFSWEHLQRSTFTAQRGDVIVLATDTLAAWMLQAPEERAMQLLGLSSLEEFAAIVQAQRDLALIVNDDMTFFSIEVR